MSNSSRRIVNTLYGLWGGLGAYRGHQIYNKDYNHNIDDQKQTNSKKDITTKYYLVSNVGVSLFISMVYICPPFSLVALYHELCNLEDFIRNRNE